MCFQKITSGRFLNMYRTNCRTAGHMKSYVRPVRGKQVHSASLSLIQS